MGGYRVGVTIHPLPERETNITKNITSLARLMKLLS